MVQLSGQAGWSIPLSGASCPITANCRLSDFSQITLWILAPPPRALPVPVSAGSEEMETWEGHGHGSFQLPPHRVPGLCQDQALVAQHGLFRGLPIWPCQRPPPEQQAGGRHGHTSVPGPGPGPREAEAAAHPRDRASSALCISGPPWCWSRWHGPPQGREAPSVSAPQSLSGNHRASSSWSTAPTGTTRSFHIVLSGAGEGREKGAGEGIALLPWPTIPQGSISHLLSAWGSGPEGRTVLRETPEGGSWVSFLWTVPPPTLCLARPPPGGLGPLPTVPVGPHQDCYTLWCHWQLQSPQGSLGSSGPCAGTSSPYTWCRSCG